NNQACRKVLTGQPWLELLLEALAAGKSEVKIQRRVLRLLRRLLPFVDPSATLATPDKTGPGDAVAAATAGGLQAMQVVR
ncbi:unnamed protein product, partial [Chrysoparadoxa australica]